MTNIVIKYMFRKKNANKNNQFFLKKSKWKKRSEAPLARSYQSEYDIMSFTLIINKLNYLRVEKIRYYYTLDYEQFVFNILDT
jgi:hypothetical protein